MNNEQIGLETGEFLMAERLQGIERRRSVLWVVEGPDFAAPARRAGDSLRPNRPTRSSAPDPHATPAASPAC